MVTNTYETTQRAVPRVQTGNAATRFEGVPLAAAPQDQLRPETLTERIERELREMAGAMSEKHRMVQLLHRHPEFEEYMELQRLLEKYGRRLG